jgi:hypothetical protein
MDMLPTAMIATMQIQPLTQQLRGTWMLIATDTGLEQQQLLALLRWVWCLTTLIVTI